MEMKQKKTYFIEMLKPGIYHDRAVGRHGGISFGDGRDLFDVFGTASIVSGPGRDRRHAAEYQVSHVLYAKGNSNGRKWLL